MAVPMDPQLQQAMMDLQVKDTVLTFNTLVERTFAACVRDFRNSALDKKEKDCIDMYTTRYFKYAQRTNMRFMEHQQRQAAKTEQALVSGSL